MLINCEELILSGICTENKFINFLTGKMVKFARIGLKTFFVEANIK